jgi:ketosteroid isomerase-like protein
MSLENVERVRQGYQAFNATKQIDFDAYRPDLVVVAPDDILGGGELHGRDAYARSAREFTETFDDFRAELDEIIDVGGDRILVFVRFRGRGHGSGIPIDLPLAHLHTFRGAQVARLHVYLDRNEALEAAGLRE